MRSFVSGRARDHGGPGTRTRRVYAWPPNAYNARCGRRPAVSLRLRGNGRASSNAEHDASGDPDGIGRARDRSAHDQVVRARIEGFRRRQNADLIVAVRAVRTDARHDETELLAAD